MNVLFVSNGHGEVAIAERIAREVRALAPEVRLAHLALVGSATVAGADEVGPRRDLPSGGLIAMGNLRNIGRDLAAGLLGLTLSQYRCLRGARGTYDAVVAVGDAYALWMARAAATPTVYVGTAKSVRVAPYGRFERRLLARARRCFVRDEATAERLRARGVVCESANAIVDLHDSDAPGDAAGAFNGFTPALLLFPGSRREAYANAAYLLRVVRALARERPTLGAVLSIAPGLDPRRFESGALDDGWDVVAGVGAAMPFRLRAFGRDVIRASCGGLGDLLPSSDLVLGQAGTANEAAAALGIPVVAFEPDGARARAWYRSRQIALLGDALLVLEGAAERTATGVGALLDDAPRRARMAEAGRRSMGPPGGSRRIAEAVLQVARRTTA